MRFFICVAFASLVMMSDSAFKEAEKKYDECVKGLASQEKSLLENAKLPEGEADYIFEPSEPDFTSFPGSDAVILKAKIVLCFMKDTGDIPDYSIYVSEFADSIMRNALLEVGGFDAEAVIKCMIDFGGHRVLDLYIVFGCMARDKYLPNLNPTVAYPNGAQP